MSDLRKAAEMALAKLDHLWEIAVDERMETDVLPEIKALREALSQPEQEPVAWADKVGAVIPHSHKLFQPDLLKDYTRPLYTAPPKRKWVGLTDEEIEECKIDGGLPHTVNWRLSAKVMQAKLKEKNT